MPKIFGKHGLIVCDQNDLLRSLAPHFAKAKEEGKVEFFFEKLCMLWYNWYPSDLEDLEKESEGDPDLRA